MGSGSVSEDLQKKYNETQNKQTKIQDTKSVAILDQQLQKAEKQFEREKKEHQKLLIWLHNNTVKGATLSAEIDELKKNRVELLEKQGFQPKAQPKLLHQPTGLSEGQTQKWNETIEKYELELQQEEEKRTDKYNKELQKLQEAFEAEMQSRAKEMPKPEGGSIINPMGEGKNESKAGDKPDEDMGIQPLAASNSQGIQAQDAEDMQNEMDESQKQVLDNMQKQDDDGEGPNKRLKLPDKAGVYVQNYMLSVKKSNTTEDSKA